MFPRIADDVCPTNEERADLTVWDSIADLILSVRGDAVIEGVSSP